MLHGENLVVRIHGFKEQTTVLYLGRSNYHCSCFVFSVLLLVNGSANLSVFKIMARHMIRCCKHAAIHQDKVSYV